MKNIKRSLILIVLITITLTAFSRGTNKDTMFQTSTLNALLEAVYDGNLTLKELTKHGDFGIGTFHSLDGEMIVLEKKVYQVKADGKVYRPGGNTTTPFAMVTYFDPDQEVSITEPLTIETLKTYINSLLPSPNIICAIKLDGEFTSIKTRSVPGQSKPYPRLVEVVKNQPEFEFENITGTIVGYYLPAYLNGVNMPGYHFHFLSDDKTSGGHLLELTIKEVTLALDNTYGINLSLPEQSDFYRTNISDDKHDEIKTIEQ